MIASGKVDRSIRIELRARDYLVGEIGPNKWIRWGRLMGLVEAGAIHGY